jgi:hypothetical protein
MGLLKILTNPENFRFYSGRGSASTGDSFGQKSIRYGRDRRDGGSSGQPYIQTPIPDDAPVNITDFILRNGALGNLTRVATDESRLFKMFTDPLSPNGTLFIAKQNILARQNPPELGTARVYNPLNTLAQIALSPIGGHIKKDASDPITAALDLIDPTRTYAYQTKDLDAGGDNRLLLLKDSKILNNVSINPFNPFSVATSPENILRYSGGPNSNGLGNTIIRRYSNTDGFFDQLITVGNSPYLGNVNSPLHTTWLLTSQQTNTRSDEVTSGGPLFYDTFTRNYIDEVLKSNTKKTTITSISPNYSTKNITSKYGVLDASTPKNLISYTNGSGLSDNLEVYDITQDYQLNDVSANAYDLVEFKIAILNYDGPKTSSTNTPNTYKFLHFRSFLDNINDNYNAEWDSFRYLGRGEKFYTYQGFDRNISLGFTVPSFTREQMKSNYLKLGYLASALTPNYNIQGGYMRGPLIRLTIGDYIKNQWGFIETLTYDVNGDNSTWEINIDDQGNKIPESDPNWVGELPHHIKISNFTFVPIQNFVPQTFNPNFISANQTFINQV